MNGLSLPECLDDATHSKQKLIDIFYPKNTRKLTQHSGDFDASFEGWNLYIAQLDTPCGATIKPR